MIPGILAQQAASTEVDPTDLQIVLNFFDGTYTFFGEELTVADVLVVPGNVVPGFGLPFIQSGSRVADGVVEDYLVTGAFTVTIEYVAYDDLAGHIYPMTIYDNTLNDQINFAIVQSGGDVYAEGFDEHAFFDANPLDSRFVFTNSPVAIATPGRVIRAGIMRSTEALAISVMGEDPSDDPDLHTETPIVGVISARVFLAEYSTSNVIPVGYIRKMIIEPFGTLDLLAAATAASHIVTEAVAPVLTSDATIQLEEGYKLEHALTAGEFVSLNIQGGVDAAKFNINNFVTLRWSGGGFKNFEAPDDANTDNVYEVTVRATDAFGNTTDQSITVEVLDAESEGLLNGTSATGAFSFARYLLTAFQGTNLKTLVSGNVSVLANQTGSNDITQTSSAARPLFVASAGPQSRPCARLDGVDDFFNGALGSSYWSTSSAFAVVVVSFGVLTANDALTPRNHAVLSVNSGFGVYGKSTGDALGYNDDGTPDTAAAAGLVAGQVHVITLRHEGGDVYVSVDGGAEVSAASGDTATLAAALKVGLNQLGQFTSMDLYELATWTTIPSGVTRAAIVADCLAFYA